jgi:hypothetical protein
MCEWRYILPQSRGLSKHCGLWSGARMCDRDMLWAERVYEQLWVQWWRKRHDLDRRDAFQQGRSIWSHRRRGPDSRWIVSSGLDAAVFILHW